MGNSGCFPRGKPATQSTVHARCFSVSIIHLTLTRTMGSLTCTQMLRHAAAQAWGGGDTLTESALEVGSGEKNPLPHRGIEPASAACRSDALPTELHPPRDRVWKGHRANLFLYLQSCPGSSCGGCHCQWRSRWTGGHGWATAVSVGPPQRATSGRCTARTPGPLPPANRRASWGHMTCSRLTFSDRAVPSKTCQQTRESYK